MRSIFIKEINSFFSSIVGYVAILVFLFFCGLLLWIMPDYSILGYGFAAMDRFFQFAPWLLLLLVPAVTMRSFSDEFRGGTIEWLSTKPLTDLEIILGKYFATIALIVFALLPTLIYVYTISNLALPDNSPDAAAITGSYIGLFFLAATFAAIGVFCSSLTSNQVVGFLVSLVSCYLLYTGFEHLSHLPDLSAGIDYYLSQIGMEFHYTSISRGLIDTRDVIYFLSAITLFIALTRFSLNNKTKDMASGGSRRRQAIIRLVTMGLILICLNVLASYMHTGLDLTREKRFTLSASTKKMLREMKEPAVIDVYLKGNFPADLQRMQEAVREQLTAFKMIAGNKIIYRFINPLEGKPENEHKQIVRDLQQKGIDVMSLPTQEEEGYSVKVYFPYALLHYNNRETPIALLESPPGKDRSEQITTANALLEYKFASAINLLSKPTKTRIGYILGNDEAKSVKTADMLYTLATYYALDSIDLGHTIHISNAYDAIIINQPTIPFSEPDKLKIDQYVMRGGHVLWAINQMTASMDSFTKDHLKFMTMDRGLNIDDMLFKYGVRVNNDIVEDLQCVKIPIVVGPGKQEYLPWVYFPRINPIATHPIVRNMDFILGSFTNTIDTILTAGINKTVLLTTSKYSRAAGSPAIISLTKANYPGQPDNYNKSYRPVAVLMEGKFHSLYQNRLAPDYLMRLDSLHEQFVPFCKDSTSMIVTSIGNVFFNDFSNREGPMEMGYYKYTNEYFANKSFLMNCLEYLTDHSGILEARAKDVKMRLLDKGRVKSELTMWQWVNVGVPIALVLVFASAFMFFRKRRYEVKPAK